MPYLQEVTGKLLLEDGIGIRGITLPEVTSVGSFGVIALLPSSGDDPIPDGRISLPRLQYVVDASEGFAVGMVNIAGPIEFPLLESIAGFTQISMIVNASIIDFSSLNSVGGLNVSYIQGVPDAYFDDPININGDLELIGVESICYSSLDHLEENVTGATTVSGVGCTRPVAYPSCNYPPTTADCS